MSSNNRQVMLRVWPYIWPAGRLDIKIRVVAAITALIVSKLIMAYVPFLYGGAVDGLSGQASDLLLGAIGLTVAYGGARILAAAFQQLRDAIFSPVGQRAVRLLAVETFEHIHKLSLSFHLSRKTGGLSRLIERGVRGVAFLLRFSVLSVGPLMIELLLVCGIFMWLFNWTYMLVVVATVVLYAVFTFTVSEWRVKLRREMNDRDTEANQKAIDSLLNYETVKYFNAEAHELARYDNAMRGFEAASRRTDYSLAFLNFGQAFIITVGLTGIMVMSGLQVQAGEVTVGAFVMANAYMIQITMPLNFLGTVYREIRQALVDMEDMFKILDTPRGIEETKTPVTIDTPKGQVAFKNVSFAYTDERSILKDVSFDVKAGQNIAFVGPSGSGKTTISRLLYRFYDVDAGGITIDGVDLRDMALADVQSLIGMVPQDTVLFNDTIGYNIGYGKFAATRQEVMDAAKDARIEGFIQSLPDGYETQVGERGLKLSGGEKQRVSIARALLKDPKILILDEATSALDTATERDIQNTLEEISHGRTTIHIAHRLSTIQHCDQIYILDGGVITEAGSHAELIARGGTYARMWQTQEREVEKES